MTAAVFRFNVQAYGAWTKPMVQVLGTSKEWHVLCWSRHYYNYMAWIEEVSMKRIGMLWFHT